MLLPNIPQKFVGTGGLDSATEANCEAIKRKIGRELALISLPLLVIGGGAWFISARNAANSWPPRIEFEKFERVELTPLDAHRGYDWAAKTKVEIRGKRDLDVRSVRGTGPNVIKMGAPNPKLQTISLISSRLFDRTGVDHPVCRVDGTKRFYPILFGVGNKHLRAGSLANDLMVTAMKGQIPCDGWQKSLEPYALEVVSSDLETWPLTIKVPVKMSGINR